MMKNINYLVMDVDGTLTDGKLYIGHNGEVFKVFNIKDGAGIHDVLPKYNIVPIVVTGRSSVIVEERCKELGITEIHQGCREKLAKLSEILCGYLSKYRNENDRMDGQLMDNDMLSQCAYIGDDIADLQCMIAIKEAGGFVGCPDDAIYEVKKIADFISSKSGGNGAVREFIDWIIKD